MFAPVFEATAERHPDVVFGKVNTEAEPGLAGAFGIRSIPSLMVLREGVLLATLPGMRPAAALDELIGKVRALDMDEIRREIDTQEKTAQPAAAKGGGA
jgi:thioredoxin 1